MKKIAILTCIIVMALSLKSQEAIKMVTYVKNGNAIEIPTSDIDSVTFIDYSEGVVINNTRWATCNVDMPGAFAATPKDAGMFYQWNRKLGWSTTDPLYNSDGETIWSNPEPYGYTWEKSNDPCPSGWRVPTNSELQSLINAGSQWTMLGRVFGAGKNTIFLPAAGCRYNTNGALLNVGLGYYWSSMAGDASIPNCLLFGEDNLYGPHMNLSYRTFGLNVRCVAENLRGELKVMVTHLKNGNVVETSVSNIDSIAFDRYIPDEGVVINGIRWATCNVDMPGAFAAKPEDAGMFYQWNRPIGWSNTDPMKNSDGGTTWDSSYPAGTTWEKVNDPCPTGWRVPTSDEYQSLLNSNCQWTTLNGVYGRLFGTGNNTIFLPAAGFRYDTTGALGDPSFGHYWSSTTTQVNFADYLNFSYLSSLLAQWRRSSGLSVRCVAE